MIMKKVNNYVLRLSGVLSFGAMILLSSCGKDDDPKPDPPVADFTYMVSSTNDLEVSFTANSDGATSYSWDFGDNTGTSDLESPTYTYSAYGTYSVILTVSNAGGDDEISMDVTLEDPQAITNGSFDDDSNWTIINHYEVENTNGSVTIANGVALFEETTNTDWKHMGIYQEVTLSAGTYQLEFDLAYTDINDVWGEVWLGDVQPAANDDYNGDDGAERILIAYNAWDCGDAKTHDGAATATGCDAATTPGEVVIETAGTYYIIFRTGGGTYGTTGIEIDNFSFLKVSN